MTDEELTTIRETAEKYGGLTLAEAETLFAEVERLRSFIGDRAPWLDRPLSSFES